MTVEKAISECTTLKIESYTAPDLLNKEMLVTVAEENKDDATLITLFQTCMEDVGIDCTLAENEDETIPDNQIAPGIGSSSQNKHNKNQLLNKKKIIRSHLIKGILGTLFGVGLMALMVSGVGIPFAVMAGLAVSTSLFTLYLGMDSYKEAFKKLTKSKTLTMDTLFTVSTITAIGVSIASLFVPWLPMMFDAGIMIFGFRHLGKALEESLKQKIASSLHFKERAPATIKKEEIDTTGRKIYKACALKLIKENDIIKVKKGEVIPTDGILVSEEGMIYKTILTGAIYPSHLKKDSKLLAGMRVADNTPFILMKVTKPAAHSYLARLDEQIIKANSEKAPIETATTRILQYVVPSILGLATIAGLGLSIINLALGIQLAITMLVSFCPCTLGFITPLAFNAGIAKALENGVQFKSGKALQKAANVNAIAFDLTGTLTLGIPKVNYYQLSAKNKISEKQFFNYLEALEKNSSHPIAEAISAYANKKFANNVCIATHVDTRHHAGISGIIDRKLCLVGNRQFMMEHGIDVSHFDRELKKRDAEQVVYLAKDKKPMGYVTLKDPLKKDAEFVVNDLKKKGIAPYIITGADEATAKRHAKNLHIPEDHVFANCVGSAINKTDRTKAQCIAALQTQHKHVAMVGDAINDTVAMVKSDFSIAVQSTASDEITQQQAGAVIKNTSLLPVLTTFAVAHETVKSIKQNLLASLAYNSTVMLTTGILVGIGFSINPGIGVALMVLQTSLILLNQYRIKRKELTHIRAASQIKQQPEEQDISLPSSTHHYYQQLGLSDTATPNVPDMPQASSLYHTGTRARTQTNFHFQNQYPPHNMTETRTQSAMRTP